jgi:hypothetical protein
MTNKSVDSRSPDGRFVQLVGQLLLLAVVVAALFEPSGGHCTSRLLCSPLSGEDGVEETLPGSGYRGREAAAVESDTPLRPGLDLMDRRIAKLIHQRQTSILSFDEEVNPLGSDERMRLWTGWHGCHLQSGAISSNCRLLEIDEDPAFTLRPTLDHDGKVFGLPGSLAQIGRFVRRLNRALVIKEDQREIVLDAIKSRLTVAIRF